MLAGLFIMFVFGCIILALSVIGFSIFLRITWFIISSVCETISRRLRRREVLELFGM